jgi:CheY-like chemotaxis protein
MVATDTSSRFKVLLADADEDWHQIVCRLLEPQGVLAVSARTGLEALDIIRNQQVHVAVLDQQMPQMDGIQVVKAMRQMPTSPPAILLVAQATTQLLHEALSMHVFSVLSKPVDFNVLLDSLARVLRRHYESRWPV